MPDNVYKLFSLHGIYAPKINHKPAQPPPITLKFKIESPPLMFIGNTSSSTGALLSGQLHVMVHAEFCSINSFDMRLAKELTHKRPYHVSCTECAQQSSDLTTWNFHRAPVTLRKGQHDYPFSFHLPGDLAASLHGALCELAYILRARVGLKSGEDLKFFHALEVKRAVYSSDAASRQSIRTFPPTNLVARCELPPLIFPIGDCDAELRIDGIVQPEHDKDSRRHWKLSRLTWRLEESQKVVSPPCPKHVPKTPLGKEGSITINHRSKRCLRMETLTSGWKSDYLSAGGCVYLEFQVGCRPEAPPACNMKSDDGTEVSHCLIIEMTMDQYISKTNSPTQLSPTSKAQLMRMMFDIIVTERSGLGVDWLSEQPPLYEQVPASPPAYAKTEVLAQPVEYESIPKMHDAGGHL